MLKFLEKTLDAFRYCFSHYQAYCWFVILVIGLMFRDDTLGVTSVIRTLLLDGSCYESMLHFFYSKAWDLDNLRRTWFSIVASTGLIQKENGKFILVGDGVKASKEAYYMPGVKKLFQESEDSSKGSFIFGHMFGAVGAIISNGKEAFCVPLRMSIQEGITAAAEWTGSTVSPESHVIQMIRNGFQVANRIGDCLLVLDRLFLTAPAIKLVQELNSDGNNRRLDIITKAKRNCTAYEMPPNRKPGTKGAPRKKGDTVHLWELFGKEDEFTATTARIYGETKNVKYLCRDLLWGPKLYAMLRFVLVTYDDKKSILVSTDFSLTPVQIIELYAKRFRIECCFREFKQQLGGFGYHFWTKALERLNHFKKKEDPGPLSKVIKEKDRERILGKIRSIECFVQLCCISMGLLQMLAFREMNDPEMGKSRYLRTKRRETMSEASVIYYFRKHFIAVLVKKPDSAITQIIRRVQNWSGRSKDAI